MTRHFFIFILTGLIISSCAFKDLRDDLAAAKQEYGYFKGQVTGSDDGSDVLIGLYKRGKDGLSIANIRTVNPGEFFYVLVNKADYVVLAFADLNGDFAHSRHIGIRYPGHLRVGGNFEAKDGVGRVELNDSNAQGIWEARAGLVFRF